MPRGSSLGLKTVQWLIRSVQLLCAVIILGIYSYFLAALSNHSLATPTNVRAVEGIAGVAVAYALLGLLLLCCLAGRTLPAFAAMCIDFALLSAYIFVAVANKDGAGSCSGDEVGTVFGKGKADDTLDADGGFTKIPSYHTACKLETACLAIAIIAIGNRDSEATVVGHEQQPPYNKYETGYGNLSSPTTHAPMVTGHIDDGVSPIEATATCTYPPAGNPYTHAAGGGDSYTHAGDHYGHAGDDYYQQHHGSSAGAHHANTSATLPYPVDNPYDSPYGPHRTQPSHLTMPPRYPAQNHHYDDGIYDRP
ncbi:hypothetical protein LLEC1_01739 [Akanthomyces lecanii]|uniref:MARVEL domain-containing protein n=1 Tax=Cordyceps confragosa TaxID=2714763 RepID=A0A179I6R5_CORDF|nr:hypothetical protein LLEC1_01739 [Akanthomyces lecanii]